ncbi:hypothetical protein BV20DRAFT_367189 [Pilatotrama ljubarskyi]|nr:hypothetical protein BV20DRAFT_367189 [Pilatotrama ljubarskyi]
MAGTEYIFMQFIEGASSADVFSDLAVDNIILILRQLAELEARILLRALPAGGSLYFTEDMARIAGSASESGAYSTGCRAQRRAFLRRSRNQLSAMVRQEVAAERRPRTLGRCGSSPPERG